MADAAIAVEDEDVVDLIAVDVAEVAGAEVLIAAVVVSIAVDEEAPEAAAEGLLTVVALEITRAKRPPFEHQSLRCGVACLARQVSLLLHGLIEVLLFGHCELSGLP